MHVCVYVCIKCVFPHVLHTQTHTEREREHNSKRLAMW